MATNKIDNKTAKESGNVIASRLGVFFIIVLLAFVGLSYRIIKINIDNKKEYQKKILSQSAVYDSQTLPAKRGEIIDCNGTVLAASTRKYNVVLDVKTLLRLDGDDSSVYQTETVGALSKVFGVDSAQIYKYIEANPNSQYYVVKRGINIEEWERFLVLTTPPKDVDDPDSLYNKFIKCVTKEEYYVRDYPQGSLLCDVVGFSRTDGVGMYGLEEYYNMELTGTVGRKYGYVDTDDSLAITTIPATDGYNLVTTLDSNVSKMVAKQLKAFSDAYKDNYREGLGANNIGCIVMKANTGEIIAMESYPNFDLNSPSDLSQYYSAEDISLMKETGTFQDACDSIWKNFCISDTYEPGSVMKPFTVAMGLETGTIKGNERYTCNGSLIVVDPEKPINCHNRRGCGTLDVKGAIAQSCNVCLMHLVEQVGPEIFLEYQNIFNLGLKTNIDLAGETRTDSVVFNEKTLGKSELATSSFGQGFNVTMIEMAAGYAALVNGGYYYEPHVVSQILTSGGSVVKNIEPRVVKQVVSESTSDKIREYCNAVVTDGSGWRGRPAGYTCGGKTGTAETLPRENGEYVVSFMAHVPADNPEYIVYVVIDRPNVEKQEDAKYATLLSRLIMNDILPYLGLPMTEEISAEEKEELMGLDLSIYTNREKFFSSDPLDETPNENEKESEAEEN